MKGGMAVASGIRQSCSRGLRTVARLRIIAAAAIPGGAAIILGSPAAAAAAGILLLAAMAAVPIYCGALSYTRRGDGIVIERGVLVRRTQLVCRRQVKYVAVSRTLSERMLGLCTLIFVTGAGRVRLPGLCRQDALRIRRAFEPQG